MKLTIMDPTKCIRFVFLFVKRVLSCHVQERRGPTCSTSNSPERLLPHVKGNIGFVLASDDLKGIRDLIIQNKVAAPARASAFIYSGFHGFCRKERTRRFGSFRRGRSSKHVEYLPVHVRYDHPNLQFQKRLHLRRFGCLRHRVSFPVFVWYQGHYRHLPTIDLASCAWVRADREWSPHLFRLPVRTSKSQFPSSFPPHTRCACHEAGKHLPYDHCTYAEE